MAIPAGISHCSSTASEDYRFVVFFPKVCNRQILNPQQRDSRLTHIQGAPHWISVWCDDSERTVADKVMCRQVPMPAVDALDGPDGFLIQKWGEMYESGSV